MLVVRAMGERDERVWENTSLRFHFGQKELLPIQRPEGKEIQDTVRNSEVQLGRKEW